MEWDNIDCKRNPVCAQVVLGVKEIARRIGAMNEQSEIHWGEVWRNPVQANELRVAIEEAKRKVSVTTVAFQAFEVACKLIENDKELDAYFALKIWGLVLFDESKKHRNQTEEEIKHAAQCVSTILTKISVSSPSPWGETSGAEGELHR